MADLSEYRVIVSPFLMSLDEYGLRERLKAWIEGGGTWIVGPLCDVRTEHAAKFKDAPYGSLEEWAGIRSRYQVPGEPREFGIRWPDGRESTGSIWYDGFELHGAEALAEYTEYPFEALAAVARKQMGRGRIIVLGTMIQPEDMQRLVLDVARDAGVSPVAEASDNLLVIPREGSRFKGMVIVETENRPGTVSLPSPMTDLITGNSHTRTVDVPAYAVMVLVGK
jgi:beta-galactosidase GanA